MTSLLCHQCQGSVYVEGYPAGVPYVCPYCRGTMPPRTPSPVEADLRDQLAAVTAERDRLAADLDAVRRAAWALLAVDGGDGHYDAARCYNARVALRLLVGEPPPAPDPAGLTPRHGGAGWQP